METNCAHGPLRRKEEGEEFFSRFQNVGKWKVRRRVVDFFKCDFSLSLSLFASFLELARLQLKWDFWGGREEKGGKWKRELDSRLGTFRSAVPLDVHGMCVRTYGHGRTNEIELESGELP